MLVLGLILELINVNFLIDNEIVLYLYFILLPIYLYGLTTLLTGLYLFIHRSYTQDEKTDLSYPEADKTISNIQYGPSYKYVKVFGFLWVMISAYSILTETMMNYLIISSGDAIAFISLINFFSFLGFFLLFVELLITNLLPKYDIYRTIWKFNNIRLFILFFFFFLLMPFGVQTNRGFSWFFLASFSFLFNIITFSIFFKIVLSLRNYENRFTTTYS